MTAMFLYILLKLDSIIEMAKSISSPVSFFFFGALVILVISWLIQSVVRMDDESGSEKIKKDADRIAKNFRKVSYRMIAWSLPCWLVIHFIIGLLPTTQEMAIIYVVPKVVNNKQVQAIPGKLLTLSNEWLDKLHPDSIAVSALKNTKIKK
jgi:hypothetical protein